MRDVIFYLPALGFFWFFIDGNPAVVGAIGLAIYLLVARYTPDLLDKLLR